MSEPQRRAKELLVHHLQLATEGMVNAPEIESIVDLIIEAAVEAVEAKTEHSR